MLNLKMIIEHPEMVKKKLWSRDFDTKVIDQVLLLAKDRALLMSRVQGLQAEKNQLSKDIGVAKSKKENVEQLFADAKKIDIKVLGLDKKQNSVNQKINDLLLLIPNLPSDETPYGQNEQANQVIFESKQDTTLAKIDVLPHYELGAKLNILDFKRAVKLSGSRFWLYKGQGAGLVRALENFLLENNVKSGYEEFNLPVLVKKEALFGTGQMPKFSDDLFKIEDRNLYLIPTAEVSLTNYYANEILDLTRPKMMTTFSTCFRAEAGSGGKDLKGLIRAHQFNKVELVKITSAEDAWAEYQKTVNDVELLIKKLELPYRKILLCSGDLGFSAQQTIDFEIWMPSEGKYREVSSVSFFGDFQARRAAIRYYDTQEKSKYAYTINGSGLAVDRIIAAILENQQKTDGSVAVPNVLIDYIGTKII